ncbi:MAG: ParB/RepB/Spo0J family partition protein [Nitrososphaerales archaeon]
MQSGFEVDDLVDSFSSKGQLSPILVRKHPTKQGKFEVIFGNRRLEAARKLQWGTIRAEIAESSDLEAVITAISENLDRKDLTDFEKALILEKLHSVTGKNYNEIAKMIGKSPAFVSLHLSMLELFPSEAGINSEGRISVLSKLTERHARALSGVSDPDDRWSLAKLAVNANLGVRELERICNRQIKKGQRVNQAATIRNLVVRIIEGASEAGLSPQLSAVSRSHYESFPSLPYVVRAGSQTFKDHSWVLIRDRVGVRDTIESLEVRTFGNFAYATACTKRKISSPDAKKSFPMRVTIIFEREDGKWKMIHDHWSTLSTEGLHELSLLTDRWAAKITR